MMRDEQIKNIIALIIENRDELCDYIGYFDPKDIKNGLLIITEDFINKAIRPRIMTEAMGSLESYNFLFMGDSILLDANIKVPKLGLLELKYMLKPLIFVFDEHKRFVEFEYMEDVKSLSGGMQAMALSALKLKGTLLQTAASMARKPSISASAARVRLYLDQIPALSKIPKNIELQYICADGGDIKLGFKYND